MRHFFNSTPAIVSILIISCLFTSCFEKKSTSPGNGRPDAPSDPTPPDGATDQPLTVVLSWNCADPEGDPLKYDIYFGASSFPSILEENYLYTQYQVSGLSALTTYHWRIVAKDDQSNTGSGEIWSFTTVEDSSGGGGEGWGEAEILFSYKYHPSITSDGQTLFMTDFDKIFVSQKTGDNWSTPEALPYPVNDTADVNFIFSPSITGDGNTLYFSRLTVFFSYWYSRKTGSVWQEPRMVSIDTTGLRLVDQLHISWNGNKLWFTAHVPPSQNIDIYYSIFDGVSWSTPQPFTEVNTSDYDETSMALSADGNSFYFTREEGSGNSKSIWITHREYGSWGEPSPMGESINMPGYGQVYDPAISYDGSHFYFSAFGFPNPSGIFVANALR